MLDPDREHPDDRAWTSAVLSEAEVDRLLDGGATYERIGVSVRAERVEQTTRWSTSSGQHLRAAVGDWMVHGPDGARWSISAAALVSTYRHIGRDRYRPIGTVQAVELAADVLVQSPEGPVRGQTGDWLIRNVLGDVWIIGGPTFAARYERA